MIIQELGKGNSIVVIDRSIYNKRMELMLNDLSKFHIIKHVPYNKKKKFLAQNNWLKFSINQQKQFDCFLKFLKDL